jgi:hypothetical protein
MKLDWERLVAAAASGPTRKGVHTLPSNVESWHAAEPIISRLSEAGADKNLCAYGVLRLVMQGAKELLAATPQKASRQRRGRGSTTTLAGRAAFAAIHQFVLRQTRRRGLGRPSGRAVAVILSGLAWHCVEATGSPQHRLLGELVQAIESAGLPLFVLTGIEEPLEEQVGDLIRKHRTKRATSRLHHAALVQGLRRLRDSRPRQ